MAEIARVKMEKLMTNPVMTPSGRRLPLAAPEDNTIGNTGKTQGDNTVTRPDNSENNIKMNMRTLSTYMVTIGRGSAKKHQ